MKHRILILLVGLLQALTLFPQSTGRFFGQYNFKFITEPFDEEYMIMYRRSTRPFIGGAPPGGAILIPSIR